MDNQPQVNVLQTVFQIQFQALQEDGFFNVDDSDNELEQSYQPDSSSIEPTLGTSQIQQGSQGSFKKISPLVNDDQMIKCDIDTCQIKFASRRAYISHMKSTHKKTNQNWRPDPLKTDPLATCKMKSKTKDGICGQRLSMTYFYHHLKKQHNVTRPSKRHHLRGFWEGENRPAFLFKCENDPKSQNIASANQTDSSETDNTNEMSTTEEQKSQQHNSPFSQDSQFQISQDVRHEIQDKLEPEPEKSANPNSLDLHMSFSSQDISDCDPMQSVNNSETPAVSKTSGMKRKLTYDSLIESSQDDFHDNLDVESEDSDVEDNDSLAFTTFRLENKALRHEKRNTIIEELPNKEHNKKFIESMKQYLETQLICTMNKEASSIPKTLGHLFLYKDSYLDFLVKIDDNFVLTQFIDFEEETFKSLNHPGDWIKTTFNDIGSKAIERLKAHAALRSYILYEADKLENLELKNEIFKGCTRIKEQIANEKLFKKYGKVYTYAKNKLENAKMVLKTNRKTKVKNLISIWNQSENKLQLEQEYESIYNRSIETQKINAKDFTKWSHWCRFNLMLSDKGRSGSYDFTNNDYQSRLPMYFPIGYEDFSTLPTDYDVYEKPETIDDPEPTNYSIRLCGDHKGNKLHEAQTIIITKKVADMCVSYIELRDLIIPRHTLEDDHPFFINSKQQSLARFQCTPHSLLYKMGETVGIDNLTVNTIRKSAETLIQSNPSMLAKSKSLSGHSSTVGFNYYYQDQPVDKAEFVVISEAKEGSSQFSPVSQDKIAKKMKMDAEDAEIAQKKAEEVIRIHREKTRENQDPGKRVRVRPKDKSFLLNLVFREVFDGEIQKFPKGIFNF